MTVRFLLMLLFLLKLLTSHGQFTRIESKRQIREKLSQNLPAGNRQQLYNSLGEIFWKEASKNKKLLDSAFYYLRKAVYSRDSVNLNNDEITNVSLCLLAQTYIDAGDIATGKKLCMQVARNYQRFDQKSNEADVWRMMADELSVSRVDDKLIPSYYDSSISLYHQVKDSRQEAGIQIEKMNFLASVGNSKGAEEELRKILNEAKENNFEKLPDIYLQMARQERYKGNLNKGLEYALEAVKYKDRAKDKTSIHNYYGELAQIFEELGEANKSVYWYKKCIEERQKGNFSQYVMYRTVSLMVVQMIKAKQEKEALALLQQMVKKDPPKGFAERAVLSQSFAYCYDAIKEYKLAEAKFIEMLNDYKEGEFNNELLHIAYYDLGKFYVERQQYAKACPYLNKAAEIGSSTIGRTKDLQLLLFKADSANGNLSSAIKHFQAYKNLNDSMFNEAKSKKIEELLIKYQMEKKDQDIKLLENESKLQQDRLLQANQTRNWIFGAAILLLAIIGLLIYNSRLKQRTNEKLQAQQKEIENKNQSLQHLLKEKEWLVKEIHHRVKNNFHTVMGLLGTQSVYLKTEEAIEAMNESRHRVHAMSLIHQKLYQSDNLSAINTTGYIHELTDYLRNSFNTRLQIQFKLEIDPIQLDISHCIPLGLILNEAITNSIKYAFPANKMGIINISFRREGGNHLVLAIADNGDGLPAGVNIQNPDSMGLKLMKGLSEDIDATFEIKNHNGTKVIVDFVYDPEPARNSTQLNTGINNSI